MVMTSYQQISAGVRAISEHRFALACDLGQSSDPTAVAVIEHIKTFHVHQKGHEARSGEQFLVRHLQRLPLGLSYVEQASRIGCMLVRPPLDQGCEFLIDETAIGRPVGDIFNANGLKPTRITITAGDSQSQKSATRWHVSKAVLISALDARLNTGELKIAEELPEAAVLKEELVDFRRHSSAGHVTFSARTGRHDDTLLATSIALWAHVGRIKPVPAQMRHARFVKTRQ
jgi:hypothetical protein